MCKVCGKSVSSCAHKGLCCDCAIEGGVAGEASLPVINELRRRRGLYPLTKRADEVENEFGPVSP